MIMNHMLVSPKHRLMLEKIASVGFIFLIDKVNTEPKLFAIRDPKASVHVFALNLISFVVGMYKTSRVG